MDGLDQNAFMEIKERMKTKFPILLEGYLRDAKAYIVTIEANIPTGSMPDLIDAAHSLKSSSGLLGVVHVSKEAERIESEAKNIQDSGGANMQGIRPHYENLQAAFSAVEGTLRSELEKARSSLS